MDNTREIHENLEEALRIGLLVESEHVVDSDRFYHHQVKRLQHHVLPVPRQIIDGHRRDDAIQNQHADARKEKELYLVEPSFPSPSPLTSALHKA